MDDRGTDTAAPSQFEAPRIALMFAAIFFSFGVVTPYLPVWLKAQGFSVTEIGILSSLPHFVRIVVGPAIGFDADRRHAHRQNTIALTMLAIIAWTFLASTRSFAAAFVAMALIAVSTCMGALVESIAMIAVRRNGHDYGRMRLPGTAAFVTANLLGGWLISRAGADVIISLIMCASIAALAAATALPRTIIDAPPRQKLTLNDARALLKVPRLSAILLASGAVQGAHGMFYAYGTLHWQTQGLDPRWFGALWSLGLVTEFAIFWWSKRCIATLGALGLFLFGAIVSVLRWLMLSFDPPLALLIPMQLLHGITFGASHIGAMHVIAKSAPTDRAATAQALHAVVIGACSVLATAFAARFYPTNGGLAYLGMALMALFGLAAAAQLRWSGAQKP